MSRLGATLQRLPLRVRLVAGFALAMLAVQATASAFVYWRVEFELDRGLDTELRQASATIQPLLHGPRVTNRGEAEATGAGWQVVDASGTVLTRGGTAPLRPLASEHQLDLTGDTAVFDIGSFLAGDDTATFRVEASRVTSSTYLLVVVRRDHRDEALRELLAQLVVAGIGSLLLTSVVGDLLARFALRPVERYRRRAEEIASGARALRLEVPEARDDEVTRLGHTLNDMLSVLEEAVDRERRFVNDASHELRTPLTLLKSRIQLARRRARTVDEHERILDELAIDVSRLAALAEELLALGSAGALPTGPTDVVRTATVVVEQRRLAEPQHAGQLELVVPSGHASAAISPSALERVLTNLLTNAFLHGRPPVTVTVSTPAEGWIGVMVGDAGEGMEADLLAHATGRFTRSDEARARPGSGLGLALVEQLVVAAGGELRLCAGGHHVRHGAVVPVTCTHGDGMTVTVLLPAAG